MMRPENCSLRRFTYGDYDLLERGWVSIMCKIPTKEKTKQKVKTIDSYMYYFFQFQCGLISEDEKYPFPPRFTRFLVISGPRTHQYYFSSLPREVMMGPRTGNDQKTGKTKAEMGIFHPQKSILTQIERK